MLRKTYTCYQPGESPVIFTTPDTVDSKLTQHIGICPKCQGEAWLDEYDEMKSGSRVCIVRCLEAKCKAVVKQVIKRGEQNMVNFDEINKPDATVAGNPKKYISRGFWNDIAKGRLFSLYEQGLKPTQISKIFTQEYGIEISENQITQAKYCYKQWWSEWKEKQKITEVENLVNSVEEEQVKAENPVESIEVEKLVETVEPVELSVDYPYLSDYNRGYKDGIREGVAMMKDFFEVLVKEAA